MTKKKEDSTLRRRCRWGERDDLSISQQEGEAEVEEVGEWGRMERARESEPESKRESERERL